MRLYRAKYESFGASGRLSARLKLHFIILFLMIVISWCAAVRLFNIKAPNDASFFSHIHVGISFDQSIYCNFVFLDLRHRWWYQ